MDSTGDSSSSSDMKMSSENSGAKNSNEYTSNNNTIGLPQAFVTDPSGFLTSIASRPNPSPEGISMLAGPLSKWFKDAQVLTTRDSSGNGGGVGGNVHPATQVAHLYLYAAAKQLGEDASKAAALVSSVPDVLLASAASARTSDKVRTKHRDETLEAVAASAVLCPEKSAVVSSGILPVLANLVTAATTTSTTTALQNDSSSVAAAMARNNTTSSIAASLSNMPASSSNAFPPLTRAHVAFLQCAVVAGEFQGAESVIRGTWPLPTPALKKKRNNGIDEPHVAVSLIMRYYYLRGIVHYACGRDQYALAHRCWWTCLSLPVEEVSLTAIQAWKKLTLVQPLLNSMVDRGGGRGPQSQADRVDANNDEDSSILFSSSSSSSKKAKPRPGTRLPKCMPKGLSKNIRALIDSSSSSTNNNNNKAAIASQESSEAGAEESAPPQKDLYSVYTHLGPAVEAVDRTAAENLVRVHEAILEADGNLEMARNCLVRVKELQVQKASQIFSVTSIPILARRWKVSPEEAKQQLVDAIKSGVVPCSVDDTDGTIVFFPPKVSPDSHPGAALTDLTAWMKLLEKLQTLDVDLSISSKYNKIINNSVKRKDDKGMMASDPRSSGPRGVEEFCSDPLM